MRNSASFRFNGQDVVYNDGVDVASSCPPDGKGGVEHCNSHIVKNERICKGG